MKKFLLSMAACAMMAGSANSALYLVGQPAGEWSPTIGIEMEEADGGYKWTGVVSATDYFCFATKLLETADWADFNANYRLSPVADGTAASDGVHELHLGAPDAAFHGLGSDPVTYFVKETDGVYTLTVSGAGETPEPNNDTWGVIGAFNEWSDDFPMTQVQPGVWKATMYDFSGQFKFRANASWDTNYGAASEDEALIEADCEVPVLLGGPNFNIAEPVEEVIFYLDVNNQTLKVEGLSPKQLALRGSFVDWEFEWSYIFQEVDDDVYMLYLDGLEADWEFKIANQDWSEEYTTEDLNMTANEMYPLYPGSGRGNMGVDNNYTEVSMFFMIEEGMFWFTGEVAGSVAQNEITAGKARYFNLHGAEVANPVPGLYIRVINGKSEKILVK